MFSASAKNTVCWPKELSHGSLSILAIDTGNTLLRSQNMHSGLRITYLDSVSEATLRCCCSVSSSQRSCTGIHIVTTTLALVALNNAWSPISSSAGYCSEYGHSLHIFRAVSPTDLSQVDGILFTVVLRTSRQVDAS